MNNENNNQQDENNLTNNELDTSIIFNEEVPPTEDLPIQTIGELIRLKREQKDLSLKVVSQQTKIHISLLDYLENNELQKLPSKTYVRGFVKSTAKLLGINQEEALLLLDQTYEKKGGKKEQKIYLAPPPENKLTSNLNKGVFNSENIKSIFSSYIVTFLKFGLIGSVTVVLIINLKNYITSNGDDSKVKLPVVISTIHQRAKVQPKPAPIPKPAEEIKEAPIQVNIIEDKKSEIVTTNLNSSATKSEIVVKDIRLKNTLPNEQQFTYEENISKDKLETYLPTRFKVPLTKGMDQIFINSIDGDSWITYKIDDKEIKKYVLRQGRTVFMRGNLIRLFIGNVKNVKVFHNNKLLNLMSTTGTKNIVLPDEAKNKYMSPLFIFQKDGSAVTSDEFIKENKSTNVVEQPKTETKKLK